MASDRSVVYFGPDQADPGELVRRFGEERGLHVISVSDPDAVLDLINRSFPACVLMDTPADARTVLGLCRRIKGDAFTAIVPVVILAADDADELPADALQAGADEVVLDGLPYREKTLRLELVLRRATRDVNVHPTTRLPGTAQIERDLMERIGKGEPFGVCYADLDHFKEFNDRYGYNAGDKVIYVLSKILRDIVRARAPGGFIGHIGGDDFIFNVPLEYLERTCDEIIELFDELTPYQYTEEDRRAGYFVGKDRRGSTHRIPLMTLSIGIVTNQFQPFTHTAQVSELAAEMKGYAKTLPGSVYVVDRRGGEDTPGDRHDIPASTEEDRSRRSRTTAAPT